MILPPQLISLVNVFIPVHIFDNGKLEIPSLPESPVGPLFPVIEKPFFPAIPVGPVEPKTDEPSFPAIPMGPVYPVVHFPYQEYYRKS